MINVKYNFEYFCSPIWVNESKEHNSIFENTVVDLLPISNKLKMKIVDLDSIFQSTYNDEYPAEAKRLPMDEALLFYKGLLKTVKGLSDELPSSYKVIFDQKKWQKMIEKIVTRKD